MGRWGFNNIVRLTKEFAELSDEIIIEKRCNDAHLRSLKKKFDELVMAHQFLKQQYDEGIMTLELFRKKEWDIIKQAKSILFVLLSCGT